MPKSKPPRRKKKSAPTWRGAVRHAALLASPWVNDEWQQYQKDRVTIGMLEPVNALQHGDLRSQNWSQTQNALEFCLLFCSKPEVLEEHASIKRELLAGYRVFLHAVDAHLNRHEYLAGNVEAARRALITGTDLLLAFRPREVNEMNELLRSEAYAQSWRVKCIREALPGIDIASIRFRTPPRPEAPDTIRREK